MNSGLIPEFDCQMVLPLSVTLKPSMLGPSLTEMVWFETFVSVKVNCTGWPTAYTDMSVVRL
jgi:hypothetical protein